MTVLPPSSVCELEPTKWSGKLDEKTKLPKGPGMLTRKVKTKLDFGDQKRLG